MFMIIISTVIEASSLVKYLTIIIRITIVSKIIVIYVWAIEPILILVPEPELRSLKTFSLN